MINQISIKTRLGWISAYENKGKIFKIKFGKSKNWDRGKILHNFKKNLLHKRIQHWSLHHRRKFRVWDVQYYKKIQKDMKKL